MRAISGVSEHAVASVTSPFLVHGVWHVMGGGRGGEKERSGRLSDPNCFGRGGLNDFL